jgi:hypothetical protein
MVDKPTGGFGSFLDTLWNSLSGHGYMDGSTWEQRPQMQADGPPMPTMNHAGRTPAPQFHSPVAIPTPPKRPGFLDALQISGSAPMVPQGFTPANLGTIVNPYTQQMAGSQPIVPQGFTPANLGTIEQPGNFLGLRSYAASKRHPLLGA